MLANIFFIPFPLSAADCMVMRENTAVRARRALRGSSCLFSPPHCARVCVSPTARYVSIAGHHVTCQGSWVLGQVFFSLLSLLVSDHLTELQRTTPHTYTHTHGPTLPRAPLRSTLRKRYLSEDGRIDGGMDVERCSRFTPSAQNKTTSKVIL